MLTTDKVSVLYGYIKSVERVLVPLDDNDDVVGVW